MNSAHRLEVAIVTLLGLFPLYLIIENPRPPTQWRLEFIAMFIVSLMFLLVAYYRYSLYRVRYEFKRKTWEEDTSIYNSSKGTQVRFDENRIIFQNFIYVKILPMKRFALLTFIIFYLPIAILFYLFDFSAADFIFLLGVLALLNGFIIVASLEPKKRFMDSSTYKSYQAQHRRRFAIEQVESDIVLKSSVREDKWLTEDFGTTVLNSVEKKNIGILVHKKSFHELYSLVIQVDKKALTTGKYYILIQSKKLDELQMIFERIVDWMKHNKSEIEETVEIMET